MGSPIFLFAPSRKHAEAIGWGQWYERLASFPETKQINDPAQASEGSIYISFSPIKSLEATYPNMQGKCRRILAIDGKGLIPDAWKWIRDSQVEQIVYPDPLPDLQALSPAPLIKILHEQGAWLPSEKYTFSRRQNDTQARTNHDDATPSSIIFAIDEFGANADKSFLSLESLYQFFAAALSDSGHSVEQATINDLLCNSSISRNSCVIAQSNSLEKISLLSAACAESNASLAVWENGGSSPYALLELGIPIPQYIFLESKRLRGATTQILEYIKYFNEGLRLYTFPEKELQLNKSDASNRFYKLVIGNEQDPFSCSMLADALSNPQIGEILYEYSKFKLAGENSFQELPLILAYQFFRQVNPFELVFDSNRKEHYKAGLERLENLLDLSWKIEATRNIYQPYFIGWTKVLDGQPSLALALFAELPNLGNPALLAQASSLALALFCAGNDKEAEALLNAAIDAWNAHGGEAPPALKAMLAWRFSDSYNSESVDWDAVPEALAWPTAAACYAALRRDKPDQSQAFSKLAAEVSPVAFAKFDDLLHEED